MQLRGAITTYNTSTIPRHIPADLSIYPFPLPVFCPLLLCFSIIDLYFTPCPCRSRFPALIIGMQNLPITTRSIKLYPLCSPLGDNDDGHQRSHVYRLPLVDEVDDSIQCQCLTTPPIVTCKCNEDLLFYCCSLQTGGWIARAVRF